MRDQAEPKACRMPRSRLHRVHSSSIALHNPSSPATRSVAPVVDGCRVAVVKGLRRLFDSLSAACPWATTLAPSPAIQQAASGAATAPGRSRWRRRCQSSCSGRSCGGRTARSSGQPAVCGKHGVCSCRRCPGEASAIRAAASPAAWVPTIAEQAANPGCADGAASPVVCHAPSGALSTGAGASGARVRLAACLVLAA